MGAGRRPVHVAEAALHLARAGVTHVAECGPGKVLAGLTKRIDSSLQGIAISDAAALAQAIESMRIA